MSAIVAFRGPIGEPAMWESALMPSTTVHRGGAGGAALLTIQPAPTTAAVGDGVPTRYITLMCGDAVGDASGEGTSLREVRSAGPPIGDEGPAECSMEAVICPDSVIPNGGGSDPKSNGGGGWRPAPTPAVGGRQGAAAAMSAGNAKRALGAVKRVARGCATVAPT
mmetsp:Transcript_127878/g.368329  ORF Transcript_127878/g.368329 Transcript_127878/m.368329 type:complete len:166 (-) Transcript_127878:2-499(-)